MFKRKVHVSGKYILCMMSFQSLKTGVKAILHPSEHSHFCVTLLKEKQSQQSSSLQEETAGVVIQSEEHVTVSQLSEIKFLTVSGTVNNSVDALLDLSHLLQNLVDFGFIKFQAHKL